MKLTFLGHSAYQIITDKGERILIDPFLDRNPLAAVKAGDVKADWIILTHAHGDHLGDAEKIARGDTTIICVSELASYLAKRGKKVHAMQIGGAHDFPFGRVKLTMALHGSMTPDGQYGGLAAGVILQIGETTLYHTGDTGIFGDMKLIGEMHRIDCLMIPIGGNYTMDSADAAMATAWLKPALVIPMHYDTFEVIRTDPQVFAGIVEAQGIACRILQPGEALVLA